MILDHTIMDYTEIPRSFKTFNVVFVSNSIVDVSFNKPVNLGEGSLKLPWRFPLQQDWLLWRQL